MINNAPLRASLIAGAILAWPLAAVAQPVDGLYIGAGAGGRRPRDGLPGPRRAQNPIRTLPPWRAGLRTPVHGFSPSSSLFSSSARHRLRPVPRRTRASNLRSVRSRETRLS
jgi:hypothetical protein